MTSYGQDLLGHFGYVETKGCMRATLCPALSLPDLFSTAGSAPGAQLTSASIQSLLAAVPPYFKQAVITPDQREATLAFGIRLMPLARQQQVIEYMRSRLHPPAGVSARLAGIPVVAAEANATLSSSARHHSCNIRASNQARASGEGSVMVSTSVTSLSGDVVIDAAPTCVA